MLQEVKPLKITAGILFYLLDQYDYVQHICHGADRMTLERAEYLRDQTEAESGVLYFHADKEGVLLFCAEQGCPVSVLLDSAFREMEAPASVLRIPYDDPETAPDGMLAEIPDGTCTASAAEQLFAHVSQVWNAFTQVQNEVLELILSQRSIDEIMKKVQELLRSPFIIVDRDMLSL